MPPKKKSPGKEKLNKLLPKKKPFILHFPEDPESNIHWVFGILVILIIVFIVSIALTTNTNVQEYLSLLN